MLTLTTPVRVEAEIRRSRFIAHAARVDGKEDSRNFLASVADAAATHNCWAWKLGPDYRFSDDGEPASTAGRPILAAIEGKGLDHAMVVVTRYFGGIKLGTGGLIRAYGGTAARCIDQATLVEVQPQLECCVEADFCWTGQIYAALEACRARKLEESFADGGISVRVQVTESDFSRLRSVLRDATRGAARVRKSG